jgi:hypothetical protein
MSDAVGVVLGKTDIGRERHGWLLLRRKLVLWCVPSGASAVILLLGCLSVAV